TRGHKRTKAQASGHWGRHYSTVRGTGMHLATLLNAPRLRLQRGRLPRHLDTPTLQKTCFFHPEAGERVAPVEELAQRPCMAPHVLLRPAQQNLLLPRLPQHPLRLPLHLLLVVVVRVIFFSWNSKVFHALFLLFRQSYLYGSSSFGL
ncbi:unnamed protein product, partial [Ectocarpus sp. 8 AP-2014]